MKLCRGDYDINWNFLWNFVLKTWNKWNHIFVKQVEKIIWLMANIVAGKCKKLIQIWFFYLEILFSNFSLYFIHNFKL